MTKDALIALKVKCPELECEIPIEYLDSLLDKFNDIDGYDDLEPEDKKLMRFMGDLPEGINVSVRVDDFLKNSKAILEQAKSEVDEQERIRLKEEKENDPKYIHKKQLREERKRRRENRDLKKEEILQDSD